MGCGHLPYKGLINTTSPSGQDQPIGVGPREDVVTRTPGPGSSYRKFSGYFLCPPTASLLLQTHGSEASPPPAIPMPLTGPHERAPWGRAAHKESMPAASPPSSEHWPTGQEEIHGPVSSQLDPQRC